MDDKDYKIVCIGGGTGLFSLLNGLKRNLDRKHSITAVVTTLDDGGSTGKLITQYGVLPAGDIRNCMVALSENTSIISQLFQYRFDEYLDKHNLGNLLIKALEDITGSFEKAINEASEILKCRGRVIPISLNKNTLCAKLDNEEIIEGENLIDTIQDKRISQLYLKEKGIINRDVLKLIEEADIILLGPGDLYTSILPNLLFDDLPEKIKNSKACKIGVAPIMTKPGETDNFTLSLWKEEIERYMKLQMDLVIAHNNEFDEEILRKYKKEKKKPLKIDKEKLDERKVIIKDLVDKESILRHDRDKLANTIKDVGLN